MNPYLLEGLLRARDDLFEILREAFSVEELSVIECPIDYSMSYNVFS